MVRVESGITDDEGGLSRFSSTDSIISGLGRSSHDLYDALGFLQAWFKKTVHLGFCTSLGLCIVECDIYPCSIRVAFNDYRRDNSYRHATNDTCIPLGNVVRPSCRYDRWYCAFHRIYGWAFGTMACRPRSRFNWEL